jgi:hypothetical protein
MVSFAEVYFPISYLNVPRCCEIFNGWKRSGGGDPETSFRPDLHRTPQLDSGDNLAT